MTRGERGAVVIAESKIHQTALRDKPQRRQLAVAERNPLPTADRLLVSDIDNTLIGDRPALKKLIEHLRRANGRMGFGVATGRRLDSALQILKEWQVPAPDLIVTAVGTEIYYGSRHTPDLGYQRHLAYRWQPALLQEAMRGIPGILPQAASEQLPFKLSYFVGPEAPSIAEISRRLRRQNCTPTSFIPMVFISISCRCALPKVAPFVIWR